MNLWLSEMMALEFEGRKPSFHALVLNEGVFKKPRGIGKDEVSKEGWI